MAASGSNSAQLSFLLQTGSASFIPFENSNWKILENNIEKRKKEGSATEAQEKG